MAECPYNKIAVMQLFYELKQKYPTIPDQVVTDFIHQAAYNREECERRLLQEHKYYQLHCYPIGIVDKMTEGKERPKTLSLHTFENNFSNVLRQSSNDYNVPIEEDSEPSAIRADTCSTTDVKSDAFVSCFSRRNMQHLAKNPNPENHCELSDFRESVKNIKISSNQSNAFIADLKLHFQNEKCGCERTSLQVEYKKNSTESHSAPSTPSSFQKSIHEGSENVRKHRSSLNVDRSVVLPLYSEKKSCTKLNLTLRPPSTDPLPPINISAKGSSLTYSTCTFDSEQGYQNQLQISISDEGNTTLSACRTKTTSVIPTSKLVNDSFSLSPQSLSSAAELRLRDQIERKDRLEQELKRDKLQLVKMHEEVTNLEKDLEIRRNIPVLSDEVIMLKAQIRLLQKSCNDIMNEIDMVEQNSALNLPLMNNDAGNWTCSMCTFKNHPMLPKCEQCDMPKVGLNNVLPNMLRPPPSSQLPAVQTLMYR